MEGHKTVVREKKENKEEEDCGEISLLMAKKHWKRCLVASVIRENVAWKHSEVPLTSARMVAIFRNRK